MTTAELRKKIAESECRDDFKNISVNINYPVTKFSKELVGISSIHQFVSNQLRGWEKYEVIPIQLVYSKKHFQEAKEEIETFVINNINRKSYSFDSDREEIEYKLTRNTQKIFNYEASEVEFLIDVYQKSSSLFDGAFSYIVDDFDFERNSDRNTLAGILLAYEFDQKDHTELTTRRNKEKSSISKIRNDFANQLSETNSQLIDHLHNANQKYDEYIEQLDTLQENKKESLDLLHKEKEKSLDNLVNQTKDTFSDFYSTSKEQISELEETYRNLLKLKEPANYWKERAETLKKEGRKALWGLTGLVIFACVTLYLLLWITPDGMLLSFTTGQASAIKWSIIYVTFISFLAYGIRALHRVSFSAFHLARDAEEREQLTYFYLSLGKDTTIGLEEKKLIMQSLFSRADTGLLKEDSSPTMPNDIIGKVLGK